MLYNSACCPPFTLEQATSLATWNLVRPTGLGVRLAKDHEPFPEVAVLFRHDPEDVRYLMNPTGPGDGGPGPVIGRQMGAAHVLTGLEPPRPGVRAGDLASPVTSPTVSDRLTKGYIGVAACTYPRSGATLSA